MQPANHGGKQGGISRMMVEDTSEVPSAMRRALLARVFATSQDNPGPSKNLVTQLTLTAHGNKLPNQDRYSWVR